MEQSGVENRSLRSGILRQFLSWLLSKTRRGGYRAATQVFGNRCGAPGDTLGASGPGQIEIFVDEPIGTISPDLHGHFTEHIGGVIYDGIWVGEGSKIPNVGGIRAALIEAMRALKPS